jgi:release factor glutamine methyltransferase
MLLEFVLQKTRVHILSEMGYELSQDDLKKLDDFLLLRKDRLPIAYITGSVNFFRKDFFVNQDVLIPRPETEEIISQTLKLNLKNISRIADIGCGSGCIGISLALELPDKKVDLYDLDQKALDVAKINCSRYNLKLNLTKSNLLAKLEDNYDLIVCNLPYVPIDLNVSSEVSYEPKTAVFSGKDGMDLYRKFWTQVNELKSKPVYIITESLIFQHDLMENIAKEYSYNIISKNALIQTFSLVA